MLPAMASFKYLNAGVCVWMLDISEYVASKASGCFAAAVVFVCPFGIFTPLNVV
jgi:hypothetical protein